MLDKVMATVLTDQDDTTARSLGEYLNSADSLILSDRHKGEHTTPPTRWGEVLSFMLLSLCKDWSFMTIVSSH